jgi:ABC-2 type transport system permease protein
VRARAFRVVTALILVVIAAAIVVPTLTHGKSSPQQVGLVDTVPAGTRAAVLDAAKSVGADVHVATVPSLAAAEGALRAGTLDVLVTADHVVVAQAPAVGDTSTTAQLVGAIAADLGVLSAFRQAGLTPAQQAGVAGAQPLPVRGLEPAPPAGKGSLRGASLIGIIIVFVMLTQYETWTLIGVMEEKSSRVVEVLLATVRPLQLLGGKVLGIGVVALAQAIVLLAFALGLAKAVGSDVLTGAAPLMLAASLLWLVVGYAFYCWVYAAAGSLAERQDQVQTLALPLSIPMILGYVLALTTAGTGHPSLFFEVLAYLPPTAPFAMPVLVGLGAVTWWGFVTSVVVSIVCTVGVARFAATIYRRAVLRTGRRVRLREVLGGAGA